MAKIKIKNLYAKDLENLEKYKTYKEIEIEYQSNYDDEKFAKTVSMWMEKRIDAIEAYDILAKDMVISPVEAQNHNFFGKNAAAATGRLLPFLLKFGNEDMRKANAELELEEVAGE